MSENDEYEFTSKEYQDMKEQKDALVKEEQDFLIISGYNAGLEWAANWITSTLSGYPENVVEFAKANAMSIRAAKRIPPQENFFDAVRNDPTMTQELKDYWLAQEPRK
jgi:broad specificity polyphosphatase/5'/3'-nucleotidase SurE